VELLTVLVIISVLAALLMPSLTRSREKGRSVSCKSNLRQIGMALLLYAEDNDSWFVPCAVYGEKTVYWSGTCTSGFGGVIPEGGLNEYMGKNGGIRACASARFLPDEDGSTNSGNGGYGYSEALGSLWTADYSTRPGKNANITDPSRTLSFADNAGWSGSSYTQQLNLPPPYYFNTSEKDAGFGNAWATMHFRHSGKANICWLDGHVEDLPMTLTLDGWVPAERMKILNLGWCGGKTAEEAASLFRCHKSQFQKSCRML